MGEFNQADARMPRGAGQAGAAVAAVRTRRLFDVRRAGFAWPFVLPVHTLLAAVVVLPALYVVWLSFYDSTFGQSPIFVGLANYDSILHDGYFWSALFNTVAVVVIIVHVEIAVGLAVALLFATGLPFSRLMLAAVLAPYAVSQVGAVVMWRFMLDPGIGPISEALAVFGIPALQWSVTAWQALGLVIVMSIWLNLPFTFIILYTARLGIPGEMYEAAAIDGASHWQMFRHMTLPALMPAILVAMLFRIIFAFRIFAEVWLLTQGGPARSTEVLAIYLYQEAFRYNEFGIASATGWIMAMAAAILAGFYLHRLYKGVVANA